MPLQEDQCGNPEAQSQRGRIQRGQRMAQRQELGQEGARLGALQLQPAQFLQLTGQDDHRDSGAEPHRHRMGNVTDQRAKSRQAQQSEQHARHQHRHQQALDAEARHRG